MAGAVGADWVTLRRFDKATEARLAAGLLESSSIPVHLAAINQVEVDWLMANALGGIRLLVPREYSQEATLLLDAPFDPAEMPPDVCPVCGHDEDVKLKGTAGISLMAVHFLPLPVPLPWAKDERKCAKCGSKWNADES